MSDVAWQSAMGKALGGDGWSLKRMRQWPQAVWRAMATLIRTVESIGRWPEALRGGIICLAPKGGCKPACKHRWRLDQLCFWCGFTGYGWRPGRLLEQAQARNCDGAVLVLDQSKAYDRVPLDLLADLLRD